MKNQLIMKSMIDSVKQACGIIKADFEKSCLGLAVERAHKVSKNGLPDFVTATDQKAEEAIKEALLSSQPHIPFVGEECGGDLTQDRFFLVDPLDGTSNFSALRDYFSVCAAYVENGEVSGSFDCFFQCTRNLSPRACVIFSISFLKFSFLLYGVATFGVSGVARSGLSRVATFGVSRIGMWITIDLSKTYIFDCPRPRWCAVTILFSSSSIKKRCTARLDIPSSSPSVESFGKALTRILQPAIARRV